MGKTFELTVSETNQINLRLMAKNGNLIDHLIDVAKCWKLLKHLQVCANALKKELLGKCFYCGKAYYIGDRVFNAKDDGFNRGESRIIHGLCLHEFLSLNGCEAVTLPLKKVDTGVATERLQLIDRYFSSESFWICLYSHGITIFIDEKNRKKQKPYSLDYFEIIEIAKSLPPLINEIESKRHGGCYFCEKPLYENESKYQSADKKIIHTDCLLEFFKSDKAKAVKMPLTEVRSQDRSDPYGKIV